MRALRMHGFANELQETLHRCIEKGGLLNDAASFGFLLRAVQPEDPLVMVVTTWTASQMTRNNLQLSMEEQYKICVEFPYFNELIIVAGLEQRARSELNSVEDKFDDLSMSGE